MLFSAIKSIAKILLNIPYLLLSCMPKNNNMWVFGAWNGKKYADNSRALYEHIIKNKKNVRPVWIVKEKKLYNQMKLEGLPVEINTSLKGLYLQSRAAVVFFSHSVDWDLSSFVISGNVKRIQLWHGIPIKKIGIDDGKKLDSRLKRIVSGVLYIYKSEKIDLMIAAGYKDKKIYESAFNLPEVKIKITGLPRCDLMYKKINQKKKNSNNKKIIYLPTFRGEVGSEFELLKENYFPLMEIKKFLNEKDANLHIKLHPANTLSSKNSNLISENIIILNSDFNIYEKLHEYDAVITDFSSVYFDALFLQLPIVVVALDINNYLKRDREGFYYDVNDMVPGGICESWMQALHRLDEIFLKNEVSDAYVKAINCFYKFHDDKSSERVFLEVKKLMEI